MQTEHISRETGLGAIAVEVDQAVRVGPVVHVKHQAMTNGQHGLGCLESYLLGEKNSARYGLHDWGHYGDIKATSIIIEHAPRGFVVTLKKDSKAENLQRGSEGFSIPAEAKTSGYMGDYVKIDWIYPGKAIMGLGIPRRYFYAVEIAAKKEGYPSLHIDATNNGFSYWARQEFGLKIPKESHDVIVSTYQNFRSHPQEYVEHVREHSSYIRDYQEELLPKDIDPNEPHTIPRTFMEVLGALYALKGGHLHFYKKF